MAARPDDAVVATIGDDSIHAGEVNRLDSIPDGAEKSKIWHDLLGHLDALRRGESLGERLRLEWVKVSLRQWKNARRVFAN